MPEIYPNNATSALAVGINNIQTAITLQVATASRFPYPAVGEHYWATMFAIDGDREVNHEIVKVVGRTDNTLQVERGHQGTGTRSWPAGTKFEARPTRQTLLMFPQKNANGRLPHTQIESPNTTAFINSNSATDPSNGLRIYRDATPFPMLLDAGVDDSSAWVQSRRSFNGSTAITATLRLQPLGGQLVVGPGGMIVNGPMAVFGDIDMNAGTYIRGNMSGAHLTRVNFQNSTPNGNSVLGVVPNGTSTVAALRSFNSSNPDEDPSHVGSLITGPTSVSIASQALNGAPNIPILMIVGATEVARMEEGGLAGKTMQKVGDPVVADVPAGMWRVIQNTTNNSVRLCANVGGVLRSVALT